MPAVVTQSFPHYERDANGKMKLVKQYAKGDVIHDDDELAAIAHEHMHKLTRPPHNPAHCPEDCPKLAPLKRDPAQQSPQRQAVASSPVSAPSSAPPASVSAPPPSAAPASEVKS